VNRAAYAAAAWALLFAAMSFFWALGGTLGLDTLGNEIEREARDRDPDTIAVVWVTGFLKVLGAVLALALVMPWGGRLPRRLLLIAAWAVGLGLLAYALANFVQHGLMKSGAIDTPEALGSSAATWHLLFWDPFWLLGGVLFTAAAWQYGRASRAPPAASARSAPPR
jgi:Protein of unknown function (DUF3995)